MHRIVTSRDERLNSRLPELSVSANRLHCREETQWNHFQPDVSRRYASRGMAPASRRTAPQNISVSAT